MKNFTTNLNFLILLCIVSTNMRAQTICDVDGNVYQTVTLGSQTWMKENLKVTRYSNGDIIGTTAPGTLDISTDSLPKYQWPCEGDEAKAARYGRIYTWYAATDSRNVCPAGWHVPNDAEWTILVKFLKSGMGIDTAHVKMEASVKNNFSTVYSSNRGCNGSFSPMARGGYSWWSSTAENMKYSISNIWNLGFPGRPLRDINEAKEGLPVRCLKD